MLFEPDEIRNLGVRLFELSGTPNAHAVAVMDHLIEGSRQGIPSHGVIRVPDYLGRVRAFNAGESIPGGSVDPAAIPTVVSTEGALARIDGHGGFGQVATMFGVGIVIDLAAQYGVGCVVIHNQGHVGRLGAYVDAISEQGLVALAFCSGPRWAHWVAPFGGKDGRFATNPMAYAFPTGSDPVTADFSTSAITEGGIRYRFNVGLPLPEGVLRDASGAMTTDPAAMYGDPPGTIQPMGGRENGHKGAALSLLVDVMATLLAGEDPDDGGRIGNNATLIAIRPGAGFATHADRYAAYVRSATPADPESPVLLPGDREHAQRRRNTRIEVDDETFREMSAAALELGLQVPQPV